MEKEKRDDDGYFSRKFKCPDCGHEKFIIEFYYFILKNKYNKSTYKNGCPYFFEISRDFSCVKCVNDLRKKEPEKYFLHIKIINGEVDRLTEFSREYKMELITNYEKKEN